MSNLAEKEALEYLVGLGETKILEVNGQQYSTKQLHHVKMPKPAELETTTLTALVDYIMSGMDEKFSKLLIHVISPNEVALYSELRADEERDCYMVCKALTPSNIRYNSFLDTEQFNIMLQSAFVDVGDRSLLLKYTGLIKDSSVKETGDDGISQKVTIKTGVTTVGEAVVPNPVALAPFRTFPEISQPQSKFIFRMQEGPRAAIYEADGGSWRNEAMKRIKEYLVEKLKDETNIKIIS